MGSTWKVLGLALVLGCLAPAWADEVDEADEPSASAIVVTFRMTGDKAGAELETQVLAPLRKAYAEKEVLFVEVDLSNKASSHQGRMLLNGLGLGPVFAKYRKKAGTAAIWNVYEDRIVMDATSKTKSDDVIAAVKRILDPPEEEGEEMEDDDGKDG